MCTTVSRCQHKQRYWICDGHHQHHCRLGCCSPLHAAAKPTTLFLSRKENVWPDSQSPSVTGTHKPDTIGYCPRTLHCLRRVQPVTHRLGRWTISTTPCMHLRPMHCSRVECTRRCCCGPVGMVLRVWARHGLRRRRAVVSLSAGALWVGSNTLRWRWEPCMHVGKPHMQTTK